MVRQNTVFSCFNPVFDTYDIFCHKTSSGSASGSGSGSASSLLYFIGGNG